MHLICDLPQFFGLKTVIVAEIIPSLSFTNLNVNQQAYGSHLFCFLKL